MSRGLEGLTAMLPNCLCSYSRVPNLQCVSILTYVSKYAFIHFSPLSQTTWFCNSNFWCIWETINSSFPLSCNCSNSVSWCKMKPILNQRHLVCQVFPMVPFNSPPSLSIEGLWLRLLSRAQRWVQIMMLMMIWQCINSSKMYFRSL